MNVERQKGKGVNVLAYLRVRAHNAHAHPGKTIAGLV